MPTCAILGREYQYGLMPDGKWWLTENLIAHGSGPRYAADHTTTPSLRAALDEYGALYLPPEVAALSLGIWRLPTPSEWLTLVAYATSPLSLKKTATGDWWDGGAPWLTPNSDALGSFGMDLVGAGTYLDEFWQSDVGLVGAYLASDGTFYYLSNSTGYGPQAADATRRSSIRLVSDVDPITGIYVPHGGVWVRSDEVYQGGASWSQDSALYVPHGGAWKEAAV